MSEVILPTLYEYYTSAGITTGLSASPPRFTLNDRNITIYSGSLHYFRVPKQYWHDRLRKMRAAGLNAVETYVPWNLHEPTNGTFDFGDGGNEMSDFLDIREFLKAAKDEDLFAIVRPGPYICAEWEFGGFPSWLLRVDGIKLRTSQKEYMEYVKRYFNVLLPILAFFQFTNGGPVIAFQVENEYGSTYQSGKFNPDKQYLRELRQLFLDNSIRELLFTSDSQLAEGTRGTIPEYFLQMSNFGGSPKANLDALAKAQPDKVMMVAEFWDGWFDHWGEQHHTTTSESVKEILEGILEYPASVNFYMFEGGTTFGFMNGGNYKGGAVDNEGYQSDTTSYDYDAPLTEAGDYTRKYLTIKEIIKKHNDILTRLPVTPEETQRVKFGNLEVKEQILFTEALNLIPHRFFYRDVIPMEMLPINNNSGQSYGYIVYKLTNQNLPENSTLKITGRVCDIVMVLLNDQLISKPIRTANDLNAFGTWTIKDSTIQLNTSPMNNVTITLIVENFGRVNFGKLDQYHQFKGLWQGPLYIGNRRLEDYEVIPVEFKRTWNLGLKGWKPLESLGTYPALYRVTLNVDEPRDTYVDMSEWTKGIVIVNGFVLGRYARMGPQQTLYLPAPLLKKGENEIVVFEHYVAAKEVKFSSEPYYHTQ